MVRKWISALTGLFVLALLPGVSSAQTTNNAPLGSKDNPIPVTAVGTPVTPGKVKGKTGKRGSKTNPVTGQTHPRNTN